MPARRRRGAASADVAALRPHPRLLGRPPVDAAGDGPARSGGADRRGLHGSGRVVRCGRRPRRLAALPLPAERPAAHPAGSRVGPPAARPDLAPASPALHRSPRRAAAIAGLAAGASAAAAIGLGRRRPGSRRSASLRSAVPPLVGGDRDRRPPRRSRVRTHPRHHCDRRSSARGGADSLMTDSRPDQGDEPAGGAGRAGVAQLRRPHGERGRAAGLRRRCASGRSGDLTQPIDASCDPGGHPETRPDGVATAGVAPWWTPARRRRASPPRRRPADRAGPAPCPTAEPGTRMRRPDTPAAPSGPQASAAHWTAAGRIRLHGPRGVRGPSAGAALAAVTAARSSRRSSAGCSARLASELLRPRRRRSASAVPRAGPGSTARARGLDRRHRRRGAAGAW